jgi:murein DD-endopeptidase MepM/ murein hydrolase activator NlpD
MMAGVPPRSRWKGRLYASLFLVLVVVGVVAYLGWRQSAAPPRASISPVPRFIGHATPLTVTIEAARGRIAQAEVRIVQGGAVAVVLRQSAPAGPRLETPLTVPGATLALKEGAATLEVWARDDYWRPLRRDDRPAATVPVTIDLTPPTIDVLAATQYLSQGGGGLVAFRVKGAASAEVRAGALTYPSFPIGDGDIRVALLALPWDFALGTPLTVSATDEAGNTASRGIPTEVRPRRFRSDTITVSESFLQTKVPELLPQRPPAQPLIDGFLVINRDQRRQAEEEKRRVGRATADKALWSGAFVQPRNTKVFSNFAEGRTYLYDGKEVDRQVHLGFDLASLKQSPAPAANAGVVAFAAPLTIYGNTVIVDHGLGLQTLYGHLSSIEVKPGDRVEKGQELGRSGSTGLALGDHLHFEVLIDGISVTPIEWWDAKWIRDHIDRPLVQAGLPGLSGIEAQASQDHAPREDTAPKPRRARVRR